MTSDMMIICKEDKSSYDDGGVGAVFICECSMGDQLDEFGKWFQDRFSGAPSMIEQMAGVEEHYFTEVMASDVVAVDHALATMKSSTDQHILIEYMHQHVGKHISTENW